MIGITELEFKVVHKSKDGATVQCADRARYTVSWSVFEKCFTKPSKDNMVKVSDLVVSFNNELFLSLLCVSKGINTKNHLVVTQHMDVIGNILEISDVTELVNFCSQAAQAIFNPHPKKETPAEYRQRKEREREEYMQRKEREKMNRPAEHCTFGMSGKNMSVLQGLKEKIASEV